MNRPVTVQSTEGISVLTIDHPPVNALVLPVLTAISEALDALAGKADVRGIVIAARGKTFPAGLDIRDIENKAATGLLASVCRKVEDMPIPVVAALHGSVLGGGLELALAAHYRYADRRALFAFPDVTLGLCPSAGGTQRLPRLVGATAAADLLLTGRRFAAPEAQELGLIDEVADGPLPKFTLTTLMSRLKKGLTPRPTSALSERLTPAKAVLSTVEKLRAEYKPGPVQAGEKILDCVQATILLPFDAGLTFERSAFDDLVESPESKSLRHVFVAERRTRVPPLDEPVEPRKINSIGILGLGVMGTGIAAACLESGMPVTVVDTDIARLEVGVENIIDIFDRQVERKRISEKVRDERIALLTGKTDPTALGGADIVIEAVQEDAGEKRRAFTALDAVMRRGAVLATNTVDLDIDGLASGTGRSEDIVGIHFFPPAHMIRLVEVVVGVDTSDATIATAFALARRIGKTPIVTGVGEGYIADRVHGAYMQATEYMVEDGANVAEVDAAMRAFGFPLGPFEMMDLAGVDTGARRRARFVESGARKPRLADLMIAKGRLGRKTGRGFHRYDTGGQDQGADNEFAALIDAARRESGGGGRSFSETDIQRRCVSAMANEGARIMEEGLAQRPSDIDLALILGYGFPRWRGGPMMAADLEGLLRVKRDLDGYASEDPSFWSPAPLFDELVKNGQSFASLNDV